MRVPSHADGAVDRFLPGARNACANIGECLVCLLLESANARIRPQRANENEYKQTSFGVTEWKRKKKWLRRGRTVKSFRYLREHGLGTIRIRVRISQVYATAPSFFGKRTTTASVEFLLV